MHKVAKHLFIIASVLILVVWLNDAITTREMFAALGIMLGATTLMSFFSKEDSGLKVFGHTVLTGVTSAALFVIVIGAICYGCYSVCSKIAIPDDAGTKAGTYLGNKIHDAVDSTTKK